MAMPPQDVVHPHQGQLMMVSCKLIETEKSILEHMKDFEIKV